MKIDWHIIKWRPFESCYSSLTSTHFGSVAGRRLFKIERFRSGYVQMKFAFDSVKVRSISQAKERAQEELDKWLSREDNK